jgi:predicted Zn-dependent peptidase
MRLENNSALADFWGPQLLFGKFLSPQEFLAHIQKVNAHDVQRVAQKYFREENLCLFILKPYPGLRFFHSLFR